MKRSGISRKTGSIAQRIERSEMSEHKYLQALLQLLLIFCREMVGADLKPRATKGSGLHLNRAIAEITRQSHRLSYSPLFFFRQHSFTASKTRSR